MSVRQNLTHLQAVSRLADVAARATDPGPIHQAALDLLLDAVGADRAAVLLYDGEGVLRFTAWRGLSDSYRAAVEGHSPWLRDEVDPQPVLVSDVAADATLASLLPVLRAEGIGAMGFLPLVSGGRLLGKFMLYFDEPRLFGTDELELARTVAAQVAFAIAKQSLEAELRTANAALAATLDAVTDGITVQAPDGRLLFANDEAAVVLGFSSPTELMGASVGEILERFELLGEHGEPLDPAELPGHQALLGREAPELLVRYRTAGRHNDRWSLVSARPVLDDEGRVRFAVNVFRDVTDRQRAVEALYEKYEERSTVASTLQRALAPPQLPSIPGIDLAARYSAAAGEVGGDFYDVVPLGRTRWLVAVGDVCGKGIEAASLTAMVRYTLRAFAAESATPSELLARVNRALLPQLDSERFCTLACAYLDVEPAGTSGTTTLTVSLGGHPRPLLVPASGDVRPVGRPGSLLGTLREPELWDDTVTLGPGDALVAFTDGCLGTDPAAAERRLASVLRAAAGAPAGVLAEAVERAAGGADGQADDLTVFSCRRC